RAIVEEAAGILKFRKRRERAERRLEATEGNLLRLNDLLREVRRQLTPLQRQADAARRHGGLVEELRAIRIHLAGHEIAGLQARATGSAALLDEKSRGLRRELASVADEGVFETLVADAAEVRRQLDETGAVSAAFAEERAAVERAEYDLAAAQRAFAESAL